MPHYISLGVTGKNMTSVAMFIQTCHDTGEGSEHKQKIWKDIRSKSPLFGQIRIDDELLVGLIGIDCPIDEGQNDHWESSLLGTSGCIVIVTGEDSEDLQHGTHIVKRIREVSPNPIAIAVNQEINMEIVNKELFKHFSPEKDVQITNYIPAQKASAHSVVKTLLEAIIDKL